MNKPGQRASGVARDGEHEMYRREMIPSDETDETDMRRHMSYAINPKDPTTAKFDLTRYNWSRIGWFLHCQKANL